MILQSATVGTQNSTEHEQAAVQTRLNNEDMKVSMNRFYGRYSERDLEFPKSVYARLDQAEPLAGGAQFLTFDAIDAGEIERHDDVATVRFVRANSPIGNAFLCAVTIESSDLGAAAPRESDSESDNTGWFRFDLEYANGGPALVYPNFQAAGRPAYVHNFSSVPGEHAEALDTAFSLAAHVASQKDIEDVLARAAQIQSITVYDVGQGSAAGLNGCLRGSPTLYFDFGGGVLRHRSSFPQALTGFCFTHEPPILLSHWDWDHWSSATRFPTAMKMNWIAPLQKIGPIHAGFAASVISEGQLLIWPNDLREIKDPRYFVDVHKCTGSGRNHSRLAAEVKGPSGETSILLPGDARYSAIPDALANIYASIVVPHHGADMKSKDVPKSAGYPFGRLVYSCAEDNSFGHPAAATKSNYTLAGWPHGNNSQTNVARYTFHRWPDGLGHVAIGWSATSLRHSMPCENNPTPGNDVCALAPHQD